MDHNAEGDTKSGLTHISIIHTNNEIKTPISIVLNQFCHFLQGTQGLENKIQQNYFFILCNGIISNTEIKILTKI